GLGASQVVAVEKSAGKIEKMKVIKADLAGEDLGDMGDNCFIEAPEAAGMGGLHLTVGAVAGNDDCACLFHCFQFSLTFILHYCTRLCLCRFQSKSASSPLMAAKNTAPYLRSLCSPTPVIDSSSRSSRGLAAAISSSVASENTTKGGTLAASAILLRSARSLSNSSW